MIGYEEETIDRCNEPITSCPTHGAISYIGVGLSITCTEHVDKIARVADTRELNGK